MVVEILTDAQMLRGLLFAALGVGFWIGGVAIAHYYWERHRGERQE